MISLEQEALSVASSLLPRYSGRHSPENFSRLMASIPLLCNICPRRPKFSDISHLLTHVGSKGHLSHYFKVQVRSRQEPAVRQQLDTYDRWYAKYQIEKLLSQRMVLKESKEIKAGSKTNRRGLPAVSSSVTSKRTIGAVNRPRQSTDDAQVAVIDPQLSQDPFLSQKLHEGPPLPVEDPLTGELASRHRAYVPQMRHQNSLSPSRTPSVDQCEKAPLRPLTRKRCDSTNSGQQTREQSPCEMIYPDPSNLSENSQVQAFHHSSAEAQHTIQNAATESEAGKYTPTVDDAGLVQSPVLKGIQWPGMNIFDSASPEAQRKRNQKKTNSIMLQMELNSSAVEPLERIFWPEGELKKERIITGMVESSPVKEDSPRPKRRRQTSSRTVLGDLSTNGQNRVRQPRAAKSICKVIESQDADLGDLSKRSPAMLDFSSYANHDGNYCGITMMNDEEIEWRLNAGNPIERSDDFIIFHDEVENEIDNPSQDNNHISNDTKYPPSAGSRNDELDFVNPEFTFTPSPSKSLLPSRRNKPCVTNAPLRDSHHSAKEPLPWMPTSNKENIEPILNHRGRADDEATEGQAKRCTQRYFYVNGAHPPQFFDFLPSQMEFGGLADPSFFGHSHNPLIPHGQRSYGPIFENETNRHTLPVFNTLGKSPSRKPVKKVNVA